MQLILLAAGQGKRLGPLTAKYSKAMLPVAGKPLAARVIDILSAATGTSEDSALEDLVIVSHPADTELKVYFEGRAQFVYQSERRGMAHALLQAASLIRGDFILSACDNLVPVEHARALHEHWLDNRQAGIRAGQPAHSPAGGLDGLLSLLPVEPERLGSTGMVEMDGETVTRILEKPSPGETTSTTASLPLYYFSPRLLEYLPAVQPSPRGEYELQDAIQMLIDTRPGSVAGLVAASRLTITNPADFMRVTFHYLEQEWNSHGPSQAGHPASWQCLPPTRIEPGVTLGAGAVVGPYVYAQTGSHIGDGASVRRCILLPGAVVATGEVVEDQILPNEG